MNLWRALPCGQIGEVSEGDPYLPLPAAIDQGIIDIQSPIQRPGLPPLIELGRLHKPNHDNRGIIARADRQIAAIDLVTADVLARTVYVRPTPKTAVDKQEGHIHQEVLAVLNTGHRRARIVGRILNAAGLTPWQAEKRGIRMPVPGTPEWEQIETGQMLAFEKLWGLHSSDLVVADYDDKTGEELLAPRRPIFSFPS